MDTVQVDDATLHQLYEHLSVWEKLEDRRLAEKVDEQWVPARTGWCSGGRSYYARILNAAGERIGRVHYLDCPDGVTRAWPKDIHLGGVRLSRSGHEHGTAPRLTTSRWSLLP